MSHPPKIPKEQRSFGGGDRTDPLARENVDRRDLKTGLQSSQPGDADVNLKQQGRHGDIAQNTRHQGYQQDR